MSQPRKASSAIGGAPLEVGHDRIVEVRAGAIG
jgi:hypothetical protein